jgi:hypothetical protein
MILEHGAETNPHILNRTHHPGPEADMHHGMRPLPVPIVVQNNP